MLWLHVVCLVVVWRRKLYVDRKWRYLLPRTKENVDKNLEKLRHSRYPNILSQFAANCDEDRSWEPHVWCRKWCRKKGNFTWSSLLNDCSQLPIRRFLKHGECNLAFFHVVAYLWWKDIVQRWLILAFNLVLINLPWFLEKHTAWTLNDTSDRNWRCSIKEKPSVFLQKGWNLLPLTPVTLIHVLSISRLYFVRSALQQIDYPCVPALFLSLISWFRWYLVPAQLDSTIELHNSSLCSLQALAMSNKVWQPRHSSVENVSFCEEFNQRILVWGKLQGCAKKLGSCYILWVSSVDAIQNMTAWHVTPSRSDQKKHPPSFCQCKDSIAFRTRIKSGIGFGIIFTITKKSSVSQNNFWFDCILQWTSEWFWAVCPRPRNRNNRIGTEWVFLRRTVFAVKT